MEDLEEPIKSLAERLRSEACQKLFSVLKMKELAEEIQNTKSKRAQHEKLRELHGTQVWDSLGTLLVLQF